MQPREYRDMMVSFLEGRTPAKEFAMKFMKTFQTERQIFEDRIYTPLGATFLDADRFDPYNLPDKELFQRLNEQEFREAVQKHLIEITKVLSDLGE